MNDRQRSKRYTRSWKCQVSVGELYRWILAKLSDKDIKRALHKYRDLMPRQSDWNRKLTQATNMPELGFRYLYRCGQIDESNHRTMQKMLKYIDRQDVLPYFDTILYNTNNANCSIEDLRRVLIDKVDAFLQYSTALTDDEVHPEEPYEISQCQPLENLRVTRSRAKRRASTDPSKCVTAVKRMRHNSACGGLSASGSPQRCTAGEVHTLAANCCGQVRSAIMAGALSGPAIHTLLSASLISMLAVLRMILTQTLTSSNSGSTSTNSISGHNTPTGTNSATNSSFTLTTSPHSHGLSPVRLLLAMPYLIALARIHLLQGLVFGPSGPLGPPGISSRGINQPIGPLNRGAGNFATAAGGAGGIIMAGDAHHASFSARQVHAQQTSVLLQRHVVLLSGGVGITASAKDSCIFYYCRIRLRIRIDMGPSTEMLNLIQNDRQDPYERQLDLFAQASNLLRNHSPGELFCNMWFNQLHHLEAFWSDYLSGFLKEMLMSNLLSSSPHSLVGRYETTVHYTDASTQTGQASGGPADRSRAGNRSSDTREYLPPTEALAAALRALRTRLNATGGYAAGRANLAGWPNPPNFDLHLFISRREYENGRSLLMRNLRTIPSLSRLIAVSNFLPAIAASQSSTAPPGQPRCSQMPGFTANANGPAYFHFSNTR
uniref:DNA-binding death effector domain-containing protein 2 n=1 Tax=Schistocephalus solidus TaxID=70667 RepID=A0A0X3PKD4_SCHSO